MSVCIMLKILFKSDFKLSIYGDLGIHRIELPISWVSSLDCLREKYHNILIFNCFLPAMNSSSVYSAM